MIRLICQPKGSTLCGQCCLAMLLGQTLDDVIWDMGGWKRPTTIRQLARHLEHCGWHSTGRLRRLSSRTAWPETAIFKLVWKRNGRPVDRNWHWVLWAEGRFWDGRRPAHRTRAQVERGSGGRTRELTSYLELSSTRGS